MQPMSYQWIRAFTLLCVCVRACVHACVCVCVATSPLHTAQSMIYHYDPAHTLTLSLSTS